MYYQRHVESFVIVINEVYYCYELFNCLLSLAIILRFDLIVAATLNKNAINIIFLNHYR